MSAGGSAGLDATAEVERLRRRFERERKVREEAEAIAESSTRQLFDRQRELELLVAVARAAIEADQPGAGLAAVLGALCESGGFSIAQLYMVEGGRHLRISELWHTVDRVRFGDFRHASEEPNFESGLGLPGRALRERNPVVIADVIGDPRFFRQEAARMCAVRGAVAFPVDRGGEVLAVVELFATSTVSDEASLIATAEAVGSLLGRLVERARAKP